ncbi:MAG: superoxide dismutase family protein [bacterium]
MRPSRFLACLAIPLTVAFTTAQAQTPPPSTSIPAPVATAVLKTTDGSDAGFVTAYRGPLGILLRVEGRGWPAGWHGVHLHAVGRCDTPGFTSAGAHVNHAEARPHGLLNHAGGPDLGDLQNIWAGPDGTANAEVYLAGSGLGMQGMDLLDSDGLSFLVHANPDDHITQPIGGAGARIACGVFEAVARSTPPE